MKKEQKNLEDIILEIRMRNNFNYSQNEGSLITEDESMKDKVSATLDKMDILPGSNLALTSTRLALNPPKSKDELYDEIQSVLDVLGLVPVYGDAIDIVNGVWYLQRGQTFNGILSLIAVVPVVGSVFSLATKGVLKALPATTLNNFINLIVKGDGKKAAGIFKKYAGSDVAQSLVGKIPIIGGLFTKLFLVLRWLPGMNKFKNVGKGLDEFGAAVNNKAGWYSPTLGKEGPVTGVFKGAHAVNKIPIGLVTKGGRLAADGLNTVGAKRLWFLAQDKFVYNLFSQGGFSKLSKEIQENSIKAAKESLSARGIVDPKLASGAKLNRETANMIMLNHPEVFNEIVSNAKVTPGDFKKLGGIEYNKEVGAYLSGYISERFLLKIVTRPGSIYQLFQNGLKPDEQSNIDKVLKKQLEVDKEVNKKGTNSKYKPKDIY